MADTQAATGGRCHKHWFEPAVDVCGMCLEEYCADCVVYPFGEAVLPYCLPCAVRAAGVRHGRSHRFSRRDRRAALRRRELLHERVLPARRAS